MSVRAKRETSLAPSSCASRSPLAHSRMRSPSRSRAVLPNRADPEEPRQQADRRQQWPSALPWLELDVGACVTIDFPRDVIGSAGERETRLRQAGNRVELALELLAAPPAPQVRRARHCAIANFMQCRFT